MSVTRELIENLRIRLGQSHPLPARAEAGAPIVVEKLGSSSYRGQAAEHTTALLGIGHVGTRYATGLSLQFQAELAVAHSAVASLLPEGWFESQGFLALSSRVEDHKEYLLRPDRGRRLNEASLALLQEQATKNADVQIILADGLSALACIGSGLTVVSELEKACAASGLSVGSRVGSRFARVWLEDEIGQTTRARVAVIILGERPGLGTGDGLSAYMVYEPRIGKSDADRNMISNIHMRGTTPVEAAERLAFIAKRMLEQKTSGVSLDLSQSGSRDAGFSYRDPQKREQLVEVGK